VLASGGGSNLQALLDHLDALGERRAAEVALVASDRADAGALQRARGRGIETHVLQTRAAPEGTPLESLLDPTRVDLVALAGYLKLVPAEVVRSFRGRMVNVHPGLLPAFGGPGMYGRHVHEAVLAAGAALSGPTVHFVDEVFDHGPVIGQWPVPVLHGDTPAALAARVLRAEHLLFPRVVDAVARGDVRLDDAGRVVRRSHASSDAHFTMLPGGPGADVAAAMDRMFGSS
jgi:phosphoribosylglycinamide formyltransferase 1